VALPVAKEAPLRVERLERVEVSVPGVLFVKPDHHLASYDHVMIDPIVVTFAEGSKGLSSADTRRLEAHLRTATAKKLSNVDPEKIVDEPGPCVLRMQTAFLGLELPQLSTKSGSSTGFVRSSRSVTLAHELTDSMTGVVILRYFGRRAARGGMASSSRWSGLTRTLGDMLTDLQQSLVEAVPPESAQEGPLAACGGSIYRNISEGGQG